MSQVSAMPRALLLVLLLGLGLRAGLLALTTHVAPADDELVYLEMARELVSRGELRARWKWPPGQAFFMASVFRVTGESIVWVKAAQVVLGTLSVWLVHALGVRIFRRRGSALAAASLAAVHPTLVAFTHYLWSETLFTFLLLLFAHLLLRFGDGGRMGDLVASAACFALGTLTRATLFLSLPAVALFLALRGRERSVGWARPLAVFALVAASLLAPWVVRNHQVCGGFVFVSPNGALNLWKGNSGLLDPSDPRAFDRLVYNTSGETAFEREAFALRRALEIIRSEQPLWLVAKVALHADSWAAGRSWPLRQLRRGYYGDPTPRSRRLLAGLVRGISSAALLLTVLGLARARWDGGSLFVVATVACFSAIAVATLAGMSRLHVPLIPLLLLFAGHGAAALGDAARRWRRGAPPDPDERRSFPISPLRTALLVAGAVAVLLNDRIRLGGWIAP